ncbi:MAG: hypothetical protein ACREMX_09645, partial [Gemmatimonadales bacterium]
MPGSLLAGPIPVSAACRLAVAASAVFACSPAEQRPDLVPPGPPSDRESPAGPPVATAAALNRADLEAWLDGYLPYALQRGEVAGAVVVVVKDGEVLLQKGYGYAD